MAKLNISQLDFESNKAQFIEYLKSQTQFKDYNFEGSNMNVLLDVLAYNTFQNNFYTNMAINEMFLDSAILKNSIVSHAKELNYLPRSRRSARAVVNVTITDPTLTQQTITLPAYTEFTTIYQGQNFEFVTDEAVVLKKIAPGVFYGENIEIFEGQMLASFEREGFFVDDDGILRVVLSNENVDTDSIVVFVDAEQTEDQNIFIRKNDIFGVGPTDRVFYVEPHYDDRYTVYFGNNRFGLQPLEYEDIRVRYRITSGEEGNGAFNFSLSTTVGNAKVDTVQSAQGGAERESVESIRYFAPKSIQIQERAITTNDYEILLKQKFPEIQSVAAYGGEELEPPQFGKVAVSVYLGQGQESLSSTLSATYIEYLREKSPLAVEPVFITSEFLYACTNVDVYYDPKVTRKPAGQIEAMVRQAIQDYSNSELDDFNTTMRISKLSGIIDDLDISIQSNSIHAHPYILYTPELNVKLNPSFKFFAELVKPYPYKDANGMSDYKPSVKSGMFTFNNTSVYLQDDGAGNIQIVTSDVANPKVIVPVVGSVNYKTGEINLVNFEANGFVGNGIKITAETKKNDITSPNGRIFRIKDEDVFVNVIESK